MKNIYCPHCLEKDGLQIALENMVCPQCKKVYVVVNSGLIEPDNDKYSFSVCKECGGREVIRSFMVPDGEDDNDWDFEQWCENPECPSNKIIDLSKL